MCFIFSHTIGLLAEFFQLEMIKINKREGTLFSFSFFIFFLRTFRQSVWCQETTTSHRVCLSRHLMRKQESTNPAVTKGTGKEQWQAKHMSSERDTAKLWLPHTCFPNALSHQFLFRQVILQQDQVSRDWVPAGNLASEDEIKKQSCNSTEEKNSQEKKKSDIHLRVWWQFDQSLTFGVFVILNHIPRRYQTLFWGTFIRGSKNRQAVTSSQSDLQTYARYGSFFTIWLTGVNGFCYKFYTSFLSHIQTLVHIIFF